MLSTLVLFSQDELPTGEVRIEKDAEIKLLDFNKEVFTPNTSVEPPKRNYQITLDQKVYQVEYEAPEIKAKSLKREREEPSFSSYGKIGAGLPNSFTGELAASMPIQDYSIFSADVDYFSIDDKSYENRKGSKFGANFGLESVLANDMLLSGQLRMGLDNYSLYGYNHADSTYVWDQDRHRNKYQNFGLNLGISQVTEGENPLEFGADVGYDYFRNQSDQVENTPEVGLKFYKWFGDFSIGLDVDGQFTKSKYDSLSLDFKTVDIIPQMRYHSQQFYVDAGANLSYYRDEFTVYPQIEAGASLAGSGLQVYGGMTGYATPLTMKEITTDNPYFVKNLTKAQFMETTNYYGGVKGNISSVVYNAEVGYKRVRDLLMYQAVTEDNVTKFQTLTDTANVFYFKGVADIAITPAASVTGGITYNGFDMLHEEEAWYLPAITADFGLSWVFLDNKIRANTDFSFGSRVKSPITDAEDDRDVNTLYNLDFGLEGYVTKQFGVFIDINNLLNNRYARFYDYQSTGLNVQMGLAARF